MNHISKGAKLILVSGILLALTLIFVVPKVIAQGTANVFISDIEYDPIADPLEEFVEITNGQAQSVDMTAWILGDEDGNTYTFPDFSLASGGSVRVWTGSGFNDSNDLFWGRTEPVWDDISECAYLRDGLGIDSNLIDSLCYPGPSIQFALANYSVNETAVTASISVTLSSASSTSVSVDYQTSDGTATGGSDYIVASGTLTFTVGETSKTFDVTILDDSSEEGNETINLALSNPDGGVLGTPSTAVLTIIDDEGPLTVQFEPVSFSVGEADGSATIRATLNRASIAPIAVDYQTSDGTATAGEDYEATSGTLMFAPGEVEDTFAVTIQDDTQDEPDETVNLQLSNPTNVILNPSSSTAMLSIIDNDEPEPTPTNTFTPSPTSTSTPTHTPTPTETSTQTPISTSTAIPSPTPTASPTLTPTGPEGHFVYGPIILRSIFAPSTTTPTVTPTPTRTTIPTSTPTPAICNGDFEQGKTCWLEVSTNGFDLVTNDFQGVLNPHSGSWAAWLGGEYNETSAIYQQITVPTGSPKLLYWYWIASADVCGYDVGGVAINEDAVDGYWLCQSNNTSGWVQRSVSLSAYAGQTVTLYILADTDGTLNSNLFIDDVQIQK